MLIQGSLSADKSDFLLEKYVKLLNSGVAASKILVLVQNSTLKQNFINAVLEKLTIKSFISDEEFYKRNEDLNEEIKKYAKEIKSLKDEKENISTVEENMKKIKQTLEKRINIEENVEDLIKLLVDKIYVSKIDGNRKHIKLEIYFKIGEPIILEGKLNNKEKQEYIIDNERYLSKNNNTYYCAIKENNYQSCNHYIYNCSRE